MKNQFNCWNGEYLSLPNYWVDRERANAKLYTWKGTRQVAIHSVDTTFAFLFFMLTLGALWVPFQFWVWQISVGFAHASKKRRSEIALLIVVLKGEQLSQQRLTFERFCGQSSNHWLHLHWRPPIRGTGIEHIERKASMESETHPFKMITIFQIPQIFCFSGKYHGDGRRFLEKKMAYLEC